MTAPTQQFSPEKIIESDLQKFQQIKFKPQKFRVKGNKIVRYAKALQVSDPKYITPKMNEDGDSDYSQIVAHPSIGGMFTMQNVLTYVGLSVDADDGRKAIIGKNLENVLHAGQSYNFRGCAPIHAKDKLLSSMKIEDMYYKKDLLYISIGMNTVNQEDVKVLKTIVTVVMTPGGYGYA